MVCDATFYGKRRDKLGTSVFKDAVTSEIILWKHIESELVNDYKFLLKEILDLWYTIKSVIVDGKKGLYRLFQEHPVQMCLFHQKRIIQRYITMKPKLDAGKNLKKIVADITTTTEKRFTRLLS